MQKTLTGAVKFFIYLTFFVPLVVVPGSFIFPFIVPKILLLRSLIILMLAGYMLLLAVNWSEFRPRLTVLNIALLAFFISFAISTFTGADPYHSFWDNHERMLGLFTIFHYFAYYYICSGALKSWTDWKWAMRIFLLAGSIVMIVGLVQTQNPNLLLNQGSDRVASTLGNPIYVSGYGLFLAFLAFLLLMREKNKIWQWINSVLLVISILGMFYGGSRGAVLGLLVGIGAAVLGYIIVLKEYKKTRISLAAIGLAVVLAVVVLYLNRQSAFVQKIPAVGRTVNTTFTVLKDTPRWLAWELAIESFLDRPVFGWGPNNFFYAFNWHFRARSLEYGYGETWFDNAHNIIVNTLAVQGAFGLASYLFIFAGGWWTLWRAYKKNNLNKHVAVVGSAFLVAHLVQNITVFENPTSYLYFMFWLAMLNSLSLSAAPALQSAKAAAGRTIGIGALSAAGVAVFIVIFIFNIQPARANTRTLNALKAMSMLQDARLSGAQMTQVAERVIEAMESALSFRSPHIDDIRSDIGRTAGQILGSQYQKLDRLSATRIFELAYSETGKNLNLHPLDIRNHLIMSQLAQTGAMIYNDGSYFIQAEKVLEDALANSPKRQQIAYNLANIKFQIGKKEEAEALLRQTITDDPKIGEGYWRLAYLYKLSGEMKKAKAVFAEAEKNNAIGEGDRNGIWSQILAEEKKPAAIKK
ncbi:hypothetical protein EPN28_04040 [Patescibacteria group bacterium]|nr:MAG: hypothetical protein EPN28_04040 [Patescibacteria group bacterium]